MPKNNNRLDFLSPLHHIPGLGNKRITALGESGIESIGDLLYYLPRKYIDRSTIIPVNQLVFHVDRFCAVIGHITRTKVEQGKRSRFRIQVSDETGSFEVLWLHGISFYRKSLQKGKKLLLYGKISKFRAIQMVHPLIEVISKKKTVVEVPFLPQYPLTSVMKNAHIQQKTLLNSIQWILKNLKHYPKILNERIEKKKLFPPLKKCLEEIHMPTDSKKLAPYFNRLRYEELYQLAITLRLNRQRFALPGRIMKPGKYADILMKQLPFKLTDSQNEAISVLYDDSASKKRMHRLLQGDVGSGKTIVAFFACLPSLNEGLQVVWLTPTDVLAQQTLKQVAEWLAVFDIKPCFFTGSISLKNKQEMLKGIKSGSLKFIVGTHALFQPGVNFNKIGMIVIDEQHKFGAKQRLNMQHKDDKSDFLLLSATPIPQTLAKTLYGDLDTVMLRSVPRGRKQVKTYLVPEKKRFDMEHFILKEIQNNHVQVFYIVPRIEVENRPETNVKDVTAVSNKLKSTIFSDIPIGVIHGKMASKEKEKIMNDFLQGDIKILVATTVLEVGIDVPNATIMVIENADRFGLSQLHQLRGRVGRGEKKSYTFLFTDMLANKLTNNRLTQFCKLHDGFKIADLDLTLRGPGDVTGFRQSGWDELQIADILEDADLFREIQEEISVFLSETGS
jgi:ATP-dependent DNA helicase RecG